MKLAYGSPDTLGDGLAADVVLAGIELDSGGVTVTLELEDERELELRFDRSAVDPRVLALLDDAKAAAA